MLESVAEAIQRQDYRAAAHLLQPLVKQTPEDPWVRFYVAQVQEGRGKTDKAETLYRQLLKTTTNRKIIQGARQGLQRIQAGEQTERQAAIAQAMAQRGSDALAGLILEPLSPEARNQVVPQFARMMQLDPYAARLLLPTRGWRFYRTGKLGALQVYVEELRAIGVPAFCVALETLKMIPVFQAQKLVWEQGAITAQGLGRNAGETLQFSPQEVRACLEGALPIFESVVDVDRLKKEQYVRKEQVQDHIKLLDLHLSDRLVRLYASSYQYPRDNTLESRYASVPQRWLQFLRQLQTPLPPVVGSDRFQQFAATVLDQEEFLRRISPQVELSNVSAFMFHDDAPQWPEAFHLYSTLVFHHAEFHHTQKGS